MSTLFKLIFYFKNPPIAIIVAEPESRILELLSTSMKGWMENAELRLGEKKSFSVLNNKVFLLNVVNDSVSSDLSFLLRRSSVPILILSGKMADKKILDRFPRRGIVIADTETARSFKSEEFENISIKNVGFDDKSDLWASDLNIGEETNFKINHGGDSVPFWIDRKLVKSQIIEILLTVRAGMALGLNLVQISQNLKI